MVDLKSSNIHEEEDSYLRTVSSTHQISLNIQYDKEQLFQHFTSVSNEDSDLFLQASVDQLGRILRKYYRIDMEPSNTPQSTPIHPIDGPSIVDYIVNHLQFKNNSTLVHLAARYNNTFVLNWLLSCCCDKNCKNGEHSIECLNRQEKLWSTSDKNNLTPLFNTILTSKTSSEQTNIEENSSTHPSHESIVFLLSQPSVKSKQLNHHVDNHGNLPIIVSLRRRDYILADLLLLFGAKLNVTVGLGSGSSESILHTACRDRDMKLLKFIGTRCNKVLLKRNQRDENCIFSCLRDFRSNQFQSSGARMNSSLSMHSEFLKEFLNMANSIFGSELFEKALVMKNSFGRNVLLESVMLNDHESMKVICQYLSSYQQPDRLNVSAYSLAQMSSSESSDSEISPSSLTSSSSSSSHSFTLPLLRSKSAKSSSSLLETIVFDTDKQGNSILHLIANAVIKSIENLEDFMWLFDGMKWLLTWMENNFKPSSSILDSPLSPFLHSNTPFQLSIFVKTHKNSDGLTVTELISNAKRNDKTEWAISIVSEKLRTTIRKWKQLDNHELDYCDEDDASDLTIIGRKSNAISNNNRFSKSFPASALTMSSSIQVSSPDSNGSNKSQQPPTRNKLGFLAKLKLGRKKNKGQQNQ